MNISENPAEVIAKLAARARAAYGQLSISPIESRRKAILAAAQAIRAKTVDILADNAKDVARANAGGMNAAMLDRLTLNESRVGAMAQGLEEIARQPDPLGASLAQWQQPNGLQFERVAIPLGVIGMIYESRPNVTADAAGLCILSGNAVILRGGSDSAASSQALARCVHEGLREAGLPQDAVLMVESTDREIVGAMLRAVGQIDVIIPRGGAALTQRVAEESRVPSLLHLEGNCHTYVHASADEQMAREIIKNAKMRRVGVCGSTETLLIDADIAPRLLAQIAQDLLALQCELRGDAAARALVPQMKEATESDWYAEFLAPILAVKITANVGEAIAHINHYGSHHTDAIVAADEKAVQQFLRQVDSAIVLHNASTQFADGGEFGFGAEIGIATGRLHARGPVGAAQLTTYKYVVHGQGQVRPG